MPVTRRIRTSQRFFPTSGGEGIRTPVTREGQPVFKTGAFNRSATPPGVRGNFSRWRGRGQKRRERRRDAAVRPAAASSRGVEGSGVIQASAYASGAHAAGLVALY